MLSLSSGKEIRNPTDAEIRAALASLNVRRDGEGFAILGPTEMTYLQVGGDQQSGFDMEYQEGSVRDHFRAARTDFSLDEIVAAMQAYRDGKIEWSNYGAFSRITW